MVDLRRRMTPRLHVWDAGQVRAGLQVDQSGNASSRADPKQFFHLHHMKTGGTSLNRYINCALGRARSAAGRDWKINFGSISECSGARFRRCNLGNDTRCNTDLANAAVFSYCAPLRNVEQYGWQGVDAVTVMRDPVDRVWSMYRFQTKSCYKCTPLTEIYARLDNGTLNKTYFTGVCMPQIQNHLTTNLLSSTDAELGTDEARQAEAIHNLRHNFTVIGLTSELDTTVRMLGTIFPWLARNTSGLASGPDGAMSPATTTTTPRPTTPSRTGTTQYKTRAQRPQNPVCEVGHANSSPKNNRCGPKNTHWALPDRPDPATRAAIVAHNQNDIALWAEAQMHFERQKVVMGYPTAP